MTTRTKLCATLAISGSLLLSSWPCLAQEPGDLLAPEPPKPAPAEVVSPSETVSDEQARLELARVLRNAKRYDESIVQYRALLEKKAHNPVVQQELAQVLFWTGKEKDAAALLKEIPASELTHDGKTTLASLEITEGHYDAARKLLEECLKDRPEDLAARYRLAEVLSWQKQYADSLAQYELILKERPTDKQVRRKYATVLGWAGKHEAAAAELQKTLD